MAGREWYLAQARVVTPAGTPTTAPVVTPLITGDNLVQWVRWRFPPGSAGLLGLAFYNLMAQVVPWPGQGMWLNGDNETETAHIDYPCHGALTLHSVNAGTYNHLAFVSVFYQPISVSDVPDQASAPLFPPLYTEEVLQSLSSLEPAAPLDLGQ